MIYLEQRGLIYPLTSNSYTHHSKIKPNDWGWPNFSPGEIACHGDGSIVVVREAMNALQDMRDMLGKPMIITSAYRSPVYNASCGGAPMSKHLEGVAFDILLHRIERGQLLACARDFFTGFGFYQTFLHVDLGPSRSWAPSRKAKELWRL